LTVISFLYGSMPPLAYAVKNKSPKSHKKSTLNKVDTTPNLQDTNVFTLTSEANQYQNALYENFDIDFSSAGGDGIFSYPLITFLSIGIQTLPNLIKPIRLLTCPRRLS
jgi:hypothetical protein